MIKLTEHLEQAEALAAKAPDSPYRASLRSRALGALELSRLHDAWQAEQAEAKAKAEAEAPAKPAQA